MKEFKGWLINKGFVMKTANGYSKFIEKKFKPWLHENGISIEYLEHEHLMGYIRYRKGQGVKPKTINLELKQTSYFLGFKALADVAGPIRVKGVQRRIPHDLFTEKELDNIYQKFPESRNYWTHENTLKTYHLILGLKIYQGLVEGELSKLETNHLQLDKGKIYVPSTKRANKRLLELKPFQILPMQEYLQTERQTLNKEIEGNYLFHKKRLTRAMPRIKAMINRYEPRLTSLLQIRSSVITNWLQHYNLRETQYMAGHRFEGNQNYPRHKRQKLKAWHKKWESIKTNQESTINTCNTLIDSNI